MTGKKMGKCTQFGTKGIEKNEETPTEQQSMVGRGEGLRKGFARGQQGRGMGRRCAF
jgi:hypothetical protein